MPLGVLDPFVYGISRLTLSEIHSSETIQQYAKIYVLQKKYDM